MKQRWSVLIVVLIAMLSLSSCTQTPAVTPTPSSTHAPQPTPMATPTPTLPPVTSPSPSYRVAAFYYPWYGNPEFDGSWVHWTQAGYTPPEDIASDYYPVLGAYSCRDPQVVAQHMAWLRQSGIGVIITSWWGRNSNEDMNLPILLNTAAQYGIKVAFHIEPYSGRTADSLVQDIQYLYERYGSYPAFFWTTTSTRWSPDDRPKGLFFLFAPGGNSSYWQGAMDTIHSLPQSGIVIGQVFDGQLANVAHFDGIYNYITIAQGERLDFSWALSLPPGTLYVPSVAPGNSARRVGYPENTYLPRLDGNTYNEQWNSALSVGVAPWMVTITSFNEWHEGTQIEPAAEGVNDGASYTYADYRPLDGEAYLEITRQWVTRFEAMSWPTYGPETRAVSVTLGTTNTADGLYQVPFADGPTSAASIGGRPCRVMLTTGTPARYMYFDVQNDFIYAKATKVVVAVEYFDAGTGWFWLDYDSTDFSLPLEGRFKETSQVMLRNSGTWQTATFELPDAYFGDRQHDGVSDFRIAGTNEDLAISQVTVSR